MIDNLGHGPTTFISLNVVAPMNRELPPHSTEGNKHLFINKHHEIDVYRLIDLTKDSPSVELEISSQIAQLADVCWTDDAGVSIAPLDVINVIQAAGSYEAAKTASPVMSEHIEKIEHADLSHPILLHGNEVLDGVHRLARAKLENRTTITAKVLEEIPSEAITKDLTEDRDSNIGQ